MDCEAETTPLLRVRTVEVDDEHYGGPLEEFLPDEAPLAWLHGGEGLVGWGTAARLRLEADAGSGSERFAAARRWWADLLAAAEVDDTLGVPGSGPVAFAGFTFDGRSAGSQLLVPRVLVGRRGGRTWITTADPLDAEAAAEPSRTAPHRSVGRLRWSEGSLGPRRWAAAVAGAVERIRVGELDKVVLARDLTVRAERDIDPRTLLSRLAAHYADCYTFCVDGLLGSTPELLLRRTDGDAVESLLLAGTRPRGATPEEDEKLASELATSVKDNEEHRYAIDSLRDTLTGLCSTLAVEEPRLLAVNNVWHLASPVRATLRSGVSTLDVVARMHPTAAVGGTPTDVAVEMIRELEGMDRGRYAGPVGWIDAQGRGEWGIALRCAHVDGPQARLFAGCGIVAGSDPAAELDEADSKFRVMREALAD